MRMIDTFKPAILACLLVLLLTPATLAQTTEPTAFSLKEGTVALLQDTLPTGHGRTNRRIEAAIDFIEGSLALELWVDPDHLVKATGAAVFNAEKKAIRKLDKILGDGAAPTAATDAAADAIGDLLAADALLAEIALDEAIASLAVADCDAGVPGGSGGDSDSDSDSGSDSDSDGNANAFEPDCNCNKAQRRVAKAEEQLALALAAIAEDDFEAAINAYKRAWRQACKGGLAVALCPVLEVTCPCASDPIWAPFVDGSAIVSGCFIDDNPEDFTLQAVTAFLRTEVIIVPAEGALCAGSDLHQGGGSIELEITVAQAEVCAEILTAAIVEDTGSLDTCFTPDPPTP